MRLSQGDSPLPAQELAIIGVGASAGGLEALTGFLKGLPSELPPLAIILAQHLSPTHEIHLVEILSRVTPLRVLEACDGQTLAAGCLYITPPDREIALDQTQLRLWPSEPEIHPKPSIDALFQSLADTLKNRAIGVILSGTGKDGAQGMAAIKAVGGHTLVQDPEQASFEGMPQAAIETGHADQTLPLEQMGPALVAFLNDPDSFVEDDPSPPTESAAGSSTHHLFEQILLLLSRHVGTDFANYKQATLSRRLDKRMAQLKQHSYESYLEYIAENPEELDQLFQMVLIGVTSFFRDPEAFEQLKYYLRELIQRKKPGESIRVWVPGCATGEEAYSIAMLLLELLKQFPDAHPIQIFATDLDAQVINRARRGVFSAEAVENVPPNLLQTYFRRSDGHYEVLKSLRSLILFSRHDLTENPPFLKMDLISCRNLLIYFDSHLQKHVLPIFHYALNPNAYLFLGRSDSVGQNVNLFTTLENKSKIFQRKFVENRKQINFSLFQPLSAMKPLFPSPNPVNNPPQDNISDMIAATLLDTFPHPYVVVDSDFHLLEIKGDVSPFLNWREGSVHVYLPKLVHESLQIELRSALVQAQKEGHEVITSLRLLKQADHEQTLRILVKPLLSSSPEQRYMMVIFEAVQLLRSTPTHLDSLQDSPRLLELEQELAATKDHLQIYIEELETSNEELQSLNEELQSTNEELQSTNEELETTNEELQSTNEEVQMAYTELKLLYTSLEKQETDLRRAESHNQALINNRLQGLMLVNRQYQLLALNPLAQLVLQKIGQRPADKGDVLLDYLPAETGALILKELQRIFQGQALSNIENQQQELVIERDGVRKWYMFQYTPVMGDNEVVEAVSIGLLETTRLRQLRMSLTLQEQLLSLVFDVIPTGICVTDAKGIFVNVNQAYCKIYGYTAEELLGQHFTLVVQAEDRIMATRLHDDFIATAYEIPQEWQVLRKDGTIISTAVDATLLVREDGSRMKITAVTDVSENQKYRNLLEETQTATHVAGWEQDLIGDQTTWTEEAYHIFELEPGQKLRLETCLKFFAKASREELEKALLAATDKGLPFDLDLQLTSARQQAKWVRMTCRPVRIKNRTIRLYGTLQDITLRKWNEQILLESRRKLIQAAELTQIGYWDYHPQSQKIFPGNQLLILLDAAQLNWHGSIAEFSESFVAPESRTAFLTYFAQLPKKELLSQVFCMQRSHGEPRYWTWAAQADQQENAIFGTVSDLTESRLQAQALEAAVDKLKFQNRDLLEFSHIVSHNLTGPLANLKGLIQLLQLTPDPDEAPILWANLEKSLASLDLTIKELREILTLKESDGKVYEAIPLEAFVQDILFEFRETLRLAGAEVCCDFSHAPEIPVMPVYLRSILHNLIENAIKYRSIQRQLILEIRSSRPSPDRVILSVKDNGRGINLKQSGNRIFRLYQRFHPDVSGRGLGLYMSRLQVEAMGGELTVQSEPDRGACFELSLPLPVLTEAEQTKISPLP